MLLVVFVTAKLCSVPLDRVAIARCNRDIHINPKCNLDSDIIPKMSPCSPSESSDIFQVLPVEILTLIAEVIRESDFATLLQLRLVCKAFNSLAEPLGFGSVSFLGDTKSREASIQRASSPSLPKTILTPDGANARDRSRLSFPLPCRTSCFIGRAYVR
ncbi:hypothetical protein FA13DRAFT_373623 [Coprinellus micaceus]|uniref:F-box domain-containing protein n=1 Tax=Coprinellus micaceus TaxID=71717 RepID=A0A4Y7SCW0_COPMI|nr:hypothetical protein FA13DRAFT_373623 [Coprinellus micaceus]